MNILDLSLALQGAGEIATIDEYLDWLVSQSLELRKLLPGTDDMLAVFNHGADLSDFITICPHCRFDCVQCDRQPIMSKADADRGSLPNYFTRSVK